MGCSFCRTPGLTEDSVCASWCAHESHCKDERCTDCPHCARNGQDGEDSCGAWCRDHHCSDARCSSCSFCPATPEQPDEGESPASAVVRAAPVDVAGIAAHPSDGAGAMQCQKWCQERHCLENDFRCTGCAICGYGVDSSGQQNQRPKICARWCKLSSGHCTTDDRCSECDF